MIFDSLGLGELGIVAVVAVLFLDPKKVAQGARAFGKFRQKWNALQREVKREFDVISRDVEQSENKSSVLETKAGIRRDCREALRFIPSSERSESSKSILAHLKDWPAFKEAKVVAAFAGTLEEVDTEALLRYCLESGKTLLLPYVVSDAEKGSHIAMAVVSDVAKDLRESSFGILEPRDELRSVPVPEPDLLLIPGLGFDLQGGRLGRGRGYYDRYLKGRNALKLGVAFEVQVLRKKLVLEPHDQILDGLVTEKRLLAFSLPRST